MPNLGDLNFIDIWMNKQRNEVDKLQFSQVDDLLKGIHNMTSDKSTCPVSICKAFF